MPANGATFRDGSPRTPATHVRLKADSTHTGPRELRTRCRSKHSEQFILLLRSRSGGSLITLIRRGTDRRRAGVSQAGRRETWRFCASDRSGGCKTKGASWRQGLLRMVGKIAGNLGMLQRSHPRVFEGRLVKKASKSRNEPTISLRISGVYKLYTAWNGLFRCLRQKT